MSDGRDLLRPGMVPARLSRVTYSYPGNEPLEEALEIDFGVDGVIVFDIKSDWTISIVSRVWRDPYEGIDTSAPQWDMGSWAKHRVSRESDIALVLGRPLSTYFTTFEGFQEFVRLELHFGPIVVHLGCWDGNLTVRVEADESLPNVVQGGPSAFSWRSIAPLRIAWEKITAWRRA